MSKMKFFNPRRIAIVGASADRSKLSNIIWKNIIASGWQGEIIPVNPKYKMLFKSRCYPDLKSINKRVDLALIVIPAAKVFEVIQNGTKAKPKIKNYVVFSSGFKEIGKEGIAREEKLLKLVEEEEINLLGPNCLGFYNPSANLNATFSRGKILDGSVILISQSGALLVAILDWARSLEIGFSKVISIGNKTGINPRTIREFLQSEKKASALALYLEDVKNPNSFVSDLADFARTRPVIILKAGRNYVGLKAVSSHTGSLAQDEEVLDAIMEKCHFLKAENLTEFTKMIEAISYGKDYGFGDFLIVTNAGGPGVLAADAVGETKGVLDLFEPSEELKSEMKKILPEGASVRNPIDILGDADPERLEKVLSLLSQKASNTHLLIILTPQDQTDPVRCAQITAKMKSKFKSIFTCFLGANKMKEAIAELHQAKIVNFSDPWLAVSIASKLKGITEKNKTERKITIEKITLPSALHKIDFKNRKMLLWNETRYLFRKFGLYLPVAHLVKNKHELDKLRIVYPAVLKTDDEKMAHRFGHDAVKLGIKSLEEAKKYFEEMQRKTKASQFIIQQMFPSGMEIIIGMKKDPVFGPVFLLGLGGIFTEVMKDKVILIPPLSREYIEDKIKNLKIFPILKGARNQKGYRLGEIIDILMKLEKLVFANQCIKEVDINPVIIYNNKYKAKLVDVKVFL